jgi:SAM-dependent methyltransferase
MRARLRLRQRFRDPVAAKNDAQLRWWLEQWDPVIRGGALRPADALEFLDGEEVEGTYLGRRWQLARSQVRRVLREAAIEDERFFEGKIVVEIGPGPIGFPDACPARVSIGVDPLAERYAEHDLLIPNTPAIYVNAGAERVPLLSSRADVVLLRNTLDYVEDPERALAEARRILAPGGTLIVLFDVEHAPSATQPNALTVARVRAALPGMSVVREHYWDEPFGLDGRRVVVVAESTVSSTDSGRLPSRES